VSELASEPSMLDDRLAVLPEFRTADIDEPVALGPDVAAATPR
jgi:hypothetical protein